MWDIGSSLSLPLSLLWVCSSIHHEVSFSLYLLFSFFYKGTTRSRHFVEVALEVQSNRPRRRVGWAVVILKCVIPRSTIPRSVLPRFMAATQLPLDGGNTVGDNSTANAATVGCFFVIEVKRLCEGGDGLILFGGTRDGGIFVERQIITSYYLFKKKILLFMSLYNFDRPS